MPKNDSLLFKKERTHHAVHQRASEGRLLASEIPLELQFFGGRGATSGTNSLPPVGEKTNISVENGRLTYYVTDVFSEPSIYVESLIVKKSDRGTGVGTSLLNKVKDLADKNSIPVVLDAYPVNSTMSIDQLVKWYENRGFEHLGANQMKYTPKKG